jgi:hypothetical protein
MLEGIVGFVMWVVEDLVAVDVECVGDWPSGALEDQDID